MRNRDVEGLEDKDHVVNLFNYPWTATDYVALTSFLELASEESKVSAKLVAYMGKPAVRIKDTILSLDKGDCYHLAGEKLRDLEHLITILYQKVMEAASNSLPATLRRTGMLVDYEGSSTGFGHIYSIERAGRRVFFSEVGEYIVVVYDQGVKAPATYSNLEELKTGLAEIVNWLEGDRHE